MSLIITRDGGTTWERLDDYVTFDNYASGIPILSGNGRTVFIADRNGDGNTLRLHAGHWTPVAVVDDGADEERSEGVQAVTAPSSPTPLAPDAGVAPGSLAVLMTSLGAIGILLISGIWMVLKARVIKSST